MARREIIICGFERYCRQRCWILKHGAGIDGPQAEAQWMVVCQWPYHERRTACYSSWRTERGHYMAPEGASRPLLPNPTSPSIRCSHATRKSSVVKQSNLTTAVYHPRFPSLPPPRLEWAVGKGKTVDQLEAECTCNCLLFLSVIL